VRDAYAAVVAASEKDVKLLWGRGAYDANHRLSEAESTSVA
jgi:hypothetical protein